ncbi:MAG: response regulator [Chitinophagaceae bacterium]
MKKSGPIIIIDDDKEDLYVFHKALKELHVVNEIKLFENARTAFEYLSGTVEPCFFILCDINMPELNGLELRSLLVKDDSLRVRSTPFLFLSTSSQAHKVFSAYDNNSIQGYFQKPSVYEDIISMFRLILNYWDASLPPRPVLPTFGGHSSNY